jgi:hypothetical protein
MSRFTFTLLPVALFCVAAKGGCGGTDDPVATASDAGPDGACPSVVCSEPNIPVGCHLGESTCVNGVGQCPPVICPDAGATDAGCLPSGAACNEPNIPVGCHLGEATCSNGVSQCPPVVCPDAGAVVDAASEDAGVFACDSGDGSPIQCDGRTQACKIVNGGVAPGIHAPSCIALPAACASAPTCACLRTALAADMCVDSSGDFTLTQDVP